MSRDADLVAGRFLGKWDGMHLKSIATCHTLLRYPPKRHVLELLIHVPDGTSLGPSITQTTCPRRLNRVFLLSLSGSSTSYLCVERNHSCLRNKQNAQHLRHTVSVTLCFCPRSTAWPCSPCLIRVICGRFRPLSAEYTHRNRCTLYATGYGKSLDQQARY